MQSEEPNLGAVGVKLANKFLDKVGEHLKPMGVFGDVWLLLDFPRWLQHSLQAIQECYPISSTWRAIKLPSQPMASCLCIERTESEARWVLWEILLLEWNFPYFRKQDIYSISASGNYFNWDEIIFLFCDVGQVQHRNDTFVWCHTRRYNSRSNFWHFFHINWISTYYVGILKDIWVMDYIIVATHNYLDEVWLGEAWCEWHGKIHI